MFPLCTWVYFCTAQEPKVGCGLGAHCFLMMEHTALGGVFETLSSLLKPSKSVPPIWLSALISPCFFARHSQAPSSAQANGWAAIKAHIRMDHISLKLSLMISSYSAFGNWSSLYTSGNNTAALKLLCNKKLMTGTAAKAQTLGRSKVCSCQAVVADISATERLIKRASIRATMTLTRQE